MAILKSKEDLENLKHSCKILMSALHHATPMVKPGVSCGDIDDFIREYIRKNGGEPSFLNYDGFKYSVCISINDEVAHGIAPREKLIPDNSLVKLDSGVIYKKMFSDTCKTIIVGEPGEKVRKLVEVAEQSTWKGINVVKSGINVGDIGNAIDTYVKEHGFGNVYDLGGHGIGYAVHEAPFIPHQGVKGKGPKLFENQVICIEPMVTLGKADVYFDESKKDGWTVKTQDKSIVAQFEHTVLITKKGHEVLTDIPVEELLSL